MCLSVYCQAAAFHFNMEPGMFDAEEEGRQDILHLNIFIP